MCQMSPLMWLTLMLFFIIIIMLIMMSLNYFLFSFSLPSKTSMIMSKSLPWSW